MEVFLKSRHGAVAVTVTVAARVGHLVSLLGFHAIFAHVHVCAVILFPGIEIHVHCALPSGRGLIVSQCAPPRFTRIAALGGVPGIRGQVVT